MSHVLFTDSLDTEIDEARAASRSAARRFYVYSREAAAEVDYLRAALPSFTFVPLEETLAPRHAAMLHGNTPADFFLLKKPRLSNIMDRNVDMHQIVLKGEKVVVDDHPFLGKRDVFWCYFPYSFFDKTLLGYPHSYAFRDARPAGGVDPFDTRMLAAKVARATRIDKPTVFPEPIAYECVPLSAESHAAYAELKEALFETETSPRAIIRGLKKFVDGTPEMRAAVAGRPTLNLLDLNRVWTQYRRGVRLCVHSDAKVDMYLTGELRDYVARANTFFEELGRLTRG